MSSHDATSLLHADFSARARFVGGPITWVPSPMAGVERCMLDRVGDEVARATSIVRYAPGSKFSPHVHAAGEEFLVLDGVFQDEHGDFPAGTYVRNPPTSRHTPRSDAGCTIFVKLRQFDLDDRTAVRIDARTAPSHADASRQGVVVTPLFDDAREVVRIEEWAPNTTTTAHCSHGAELLVIDGTVFVDGELLSRWGWFRAPPGDTLALAAGRDGARVWTKTGHLAPETFRPRNG